MGWEIRWLRLRLTSHFWGREHLSDPINPIFYFPFTILDSASNLLPLFLLFPFLAIQISISNLVFIWTFPFLFLSSSPINCSHSLSLHPQHNTNHCFRSTQQQGNGQHNNRRSICVPTVHKTHRFWVKNNTNYKILQHLMLISFHYHVGTLLGVWFWHWNWISCRFIGFIDKVENLHMVYLTQVGSIM